MVNKQPFVSFHDEITQPDLLRYVGYRFNYNTLETTTAQVIATSQDESTIACVNPLGRGLAVTTAIHSLSEGRQGLRYLRFEEELISRLVRRQTNINPVLNGGDITYMAAKDTSGNSMLLVINHANHGWNGSLTWNGPLQEAWIIRQTREGSFVSGKQAQDGFSISCALPPHGIVVVGLR
jgi:hypothetical protein